MWTHLMYRGYIIQYAKTETIMGPLWTVFANPKGQAVGVLRGAYGENFKNLTTGLSRIQAAINKIELASSHLSEDEELDAMRDRALNRAGLKFGV